MLAKFPSVVDAVHCAVEIQRGMIDRNADTLEDKRITFRIGIKLGDIIVEGDDIYGDGVNIAARLEALAEPGGICIVKNIARPVRVDAMSAAAVASTPRVALAARHGSPPPRFMLRPTVIAASAAVVIAIWAAAWWGSPKEIR